jgi:hypothetical protein
MELTSSTGRAIAEALGGSATSTHTREGSAELSPGYAPSAHNYGAAVHLEYHPSRVI